jgi:hypothetical protein
MHPVPARGQAAHGRQEHRRNGEEGAARGGLARRVCANSGQKISVTPSTHSAPPARKRASIGVRQSSQAPMPATSGEAE